MNSVTREIPFHKMQGVGNDFVVLDGRERDEDWSRLAIAMCHRHIGVGADGLLVLTKSSIADIGMTMLNPDGTFDVCGNGLRCLARFAYEQKAVTYPDSTDALPIRRVTIETLAGVREVLINLSSTGETESVKVNMGLPYFEPTAIPALLENPLDTLLPLANGESLRISALSTGSTHAVALCPSLPDDATFFRISPQVENHPLFPERTSLMWCTPGLENRIDIRIWERGAGETWGCGTGACAAGVVAILKGYASPMYPVIVASKGGNLHIRWQEGEEIAMTGPAVAVYHGSYTLSES